MQTEQVTVETYFAPAERSDKQTVSSDSEYIRTLPFLTSSLEAMPHIVVVLNEHRQIIFANHVLYEVFDVDNVDAVLGLRPGEAIDCNNSDKMPGGCGTARECRTCGAVIAILNSLEGKTDNQECRVTRKVDGQALDLKVKAAILKVEGKKYSIVSAVDISHEKRRRILERVFFHDVMNLIAGIKGVSELLFDMIPKRSKKIKSLAGAVTGGVSSLIEEVYTQKDLAAAENNELFVDSSRIDAQKLLHEIGDIYKCHPVAENRNIEIPLSDQEVFFNSDPTLLKRSIGNLTKNALEASCQGDVVTISHNVENNKISFRVHNSAVIPEEMQTQIFQRSFSTKGQGRGLGTYSIKLIIEKYLHGNVSFSSSPQEGTCFNITLPLSIETVSDKV